MVEMNLVTSLVVLVLSNFFYLCDGIGYGVDGRFRKMLDSSNGIAKCNKIDMIVISCPS